MNKAVARVIRDACASYVQGRKGRKTNRGEPLARSKRIVQRVTALLLSTRHTTVVGSNGTQVPYVPKDILRGACRELGVYDQDVFSYYMVDGRELRRGALREPSRAFETWFVESKMQCDALFGRSR